MKPRRRTKGVLSSLGKVPKKSKKKKNEPIGKKVFKWAGTAVLGALLLAALFLVGTRLFRTTLKVHQREAEVKVEKVEQNRAIVDLVGQKTPIPLTSEEMAEVKEGTVDGIPSPSVMDFDPLGG